MDSRTIAQRVEELVSPIISQMGLELLEVEFHPAPGRSLLSLYVDYPDGGVTLDVCSKVSRAIEGVLDVDAGIPGGYSLEVSSPGVNRPLKRVADYERCLGKVVEVKTREPIDGRSHYKGCLKEVMSGQLKMEIDGMEFTIPLEKVAKARLKFFENK